MRVVCVYNPLGVGMFIEFLSVAIVLPIIYTCLKKKEWHAIAVLVFNNPFKTSILWSLFLCLTGLLWRFLKCY